jgi:hypothetical protein
LEKKLTLRRMRTVGLVGAWLWAGCPATPPDTPSPPPTSDPEPDPAPVREPAIPLREASADEVQRTLRNLQVMVKEGATEADNPWALAHGLVAFGPDMKASDGRLAIDVIVSDYVKKDRVGSEVRWTFPSRTPQGLPLQPHDNLIVKTLVTVGVPLDRRFELAGGESVSLGELVQSVQNGFAQPASAHGWARQAWTVEALLAAHPDNPSLVFPGWQATPTQLAAQSAEALARLQAFLEAPAAAGDPGRVEKKKQDIYAHTCGGLHFVQAVARGAVHADRPDLIEKARHQLDLLLFRFLAERSIYRRTLASHPDYRIPLQVQEMKFYGHLLETYGLAAEWGLIEPDAAMQAQMHRVAADLVDTVKELGVAYGNQAEIRERAAQTYYDLIGDGCHAIRGLRLTLEHFYGAAT